MSWNKKGSWVITTKETDIPVAFKSQIITQASAIANLKPSWYQAGYFIQSIVIPPIGLVRIEDRINVPTKESSLFIPKIFKPNYQLKFYKPDWISKLTLTIYEDSMATFQGQDNLIFPNNKQTSSTATAVAPVSTSISLLAANTNRKGILIGNSTDKVMSIEKGATASVAASIIKLAPITAGGIVSYWENDDYTGAVSAITVAGAVGSWNVREFT
jgi:hypothetical protein